MAAIFVGLLVFEIIFFAVSGVLRPLRDVSLSDPVWWTLRLAGIMVGLLAALLTGSALWPKRRVPRGD
ncbi:MAG: hypothetical protein J7507_16880 [Pseudoxanthomonas sp.]|nr:hypothetical protein [Pseudoxanthomonas sp.]